MVLFVRREQGYFVIIHTAFNPSFRAVLLLLIGGTLLLTLELRVLKIL